MADVHLNSHHRDTLASIYAHPTSHNIKWVDVLSLLDAVGEVEDKGDGRVRVSAAGHVEVFDHHHGKDVTMEQIADLRRLLEEAGLGPEADGVKGVEG